MSAVSEAFTKVFGKPDPEAPNGLVFTDDLAQMSWDRLQSQIGSGWFKNRFLYLFGEGLDQFAPCLEAWSFAVPQGHADRKIIGRNAYGALLVLENGNDYGHESIFVLDPFEVTYWTNSNILLMNLIGNWLPKNDVPNFLDDQAYRDWVKANGVEPELDDVLGIKVPKPLGGELVVDNLQLDGLIDYYRTTGPIYANALRKK